MWEDMINQLLEYLLTINLSETCVQDFKADFTDSKGCGGNQMKQNNKKTKVWFDVKGDLI